MLLIHFFEAFYNNRISKCYSDSENYILDGHLLGTK